MENTTQQPGIAFFPLTMAWLVLVALTLLSLMLGKWFHGAAWLQILVAAIIWIKGHLIAKRFIESDQAHPFIRNVLRCFIAFAPIALVLTAFYGHQFAHWATL